MKVAVVVNPNKVGDEVAARAWLETIAAAFGGPEPMWLPTTRDDPGPGQVRQALDSGAELVMAWGGDGTVNKVADTLTGTGVALGILPGGTANLFARNLGIPLDLNQAVEVAYRGRDRRCDLLDVDLGGGERRISMVMCGAGWDAGMMAASESMKRRFGWGAYAVTGARQLTVPAMKLRISVDDAEPISLAGRTVLIANVGSLVAGFDLIPEATVDDGMLEVLVIDPSSPIDWIRTTAAIALSRGSSRDPSQTLLRGRSVVVSTGHVRKRQIDGDLVSNGSGFDVRVLPQVLTVRVPA